MQDSEVWWYVFGICFVTFAMVETFFPFRRLASKTVRRWATNSIMHGVASIAVVCAYLLTGIGLAASTCASSHGLLHRTSLPYSAKFAVGVLAIDLTGYAAHRLLHAVATLWRVHQVHHTETDLDLTSGFRFHPLENLIQHALGLVVIVLLGIPPAAVAMDGLITIFQNFFSHGNILVPDKIDRLLRKLVITPGMHRMHHSEVMADQNTNFGVIFSLWDRLFGTYLDEPSVAHARSGLTELPNGSNLGPVGLLMLPFHRAEKRDR